MHHSSNIDLTYHISELLSRSGSFWFQLEQGVGHHPNLFNETPQALRWIGFLFSLYIFAQKAHRFSLPAECCFIGRYVSNTGWPQLWKTWGILREFCAPSAKIVTNKVVSRKNKMSPDAVSQGTEVL